jgi:outer membrane protein OmpA-like peptidoglycan-associated protein
MRFGSRMIATMAVAFLLVPTLYAGDTAKPTATARKHESRNSRVAPVAMANGKQTARRAAFKPAPGGWLWRGADKTPPKVELFLGYSYWRALPKSPENRIVWMHGGSASLAFNLNTYFGLVADVGGYKATETILQLTGTPSTQAVKADGNVFTFLFGPRLSYRRTVSPFAQVLFGVAHAGNTPLSGCTGRFSNCSPLPSENAFAMTSGGGIDVLINRRIALRIIQVEHLLTRFKDPTSSSGKTATQSNGRLSAGIVFRFGGNPPAPAPSRPPVASCSADKSMVYAGSGDTVAVRAQASDPDNNPLTYAWTTSGGTVDGSGPEVRWNSSGAAPGTYAVRVRVDNGRNGTADCSVDVRVEPLPNRPPTMSCSAERSPILSGERTTIAATASDPDNDPLSYSWHANGGQIIGSGASVQLDTTGLAPGTYTVTGRVEDGRGGAADCSVDVDVQSPPAAPQASKMNECFFHAGSARVDNVCKRFLDDVALKLKNEPKATVVIIGFADPKEPRAARLAQTRAEAAKKYLGEKGIDGSRVVTRAGEGQKGAGKQSRRIDIIWVPEGATY